MKRTICRSDPMPGSSSLRESTQKLDNLTVPLDNLLSTEQFKTLFGYIKLLSYENPFEITGKIFNC